ncbi:MAG: hypothetical protein E7309_05255 [Butyrivibrio sp.]|nr:hypothetical protein [Butyrivibrio sp.]
MRIGIRVDANEVVASGHIMRCRTIAESLRELGQEPIFISADDGIATYIEGEGYEHIVLGTDWQDLDSEVDKIKEVLLQKEITSIILDTYYVTLNYMENLKKAGIKIMYIDDLDKFKSPVDALVNYSPSYLECDYEEEYRDSETKLYTGIEYVPLRRQFRKENRSSSDSVVNLTGNNVCFDTKDIESDDKRKSDEVGKVNHQNIHIEKDNADGELASAQNKEITDIFMTSGGSDPLGISEHVISAILENSEFKDVTVHLLAGRYFKMTDKLTQLSQAKNAYDKPRFILHQNVSNVAEIMRSCQLGVTPAGTTLYELSACGVPSVSYIFADNQIADAVFFDKEGMISYAGDYRVDSNKCVASIIDRLTRYKVMGPDERTKISLLLQSQVDGRGAERIAIAAQNMCR